MNRGGRVPVVGAIAWYNLRGLPEGPDRTPELMRAVLSKRLRLEGMMADDHARVEPEFRADVGALLRDGRLRYKEDVVVGLANAPAGA